MEQFIMKTKVYLGEASLETLRDMGIKKAFVICDPFMKSSHKVDMVTDLLEEAGAEFSVFAEVVPDPTIAVVSKAIEQMLVCRPDAVIALGGGSAIDTAKAAGLLYSGMSQSERPELIAIPTTSGTGSEVTSFAVISDPEKQAKYPLVDDSMVPDTTLLDPRFTVSVPPHITADTGMDVLTHALEAYVSTDAGDFTDACAEKAIRLVWRYLKTAVEDGSSMEAREKMHNASCLAGVAFNGASLGICHSLAHALGGRFHIPHGRSNAMLLCHVIAYNAGLDTPGETAALKRYVEVANMLGISAGTDKATVHGLIRQIRILMNQIHIPQYITECGVDREEFLEAADGMAQLALDDNCTVTNPRKPSKEELENLYRCLCKGGY